jgi:LysM repeat protein
MKKQTLILVPSLLAMIILPLTAGSVTPSSKQNKVLNLYGRQEPSATSSEETPLPDGVNLVANTRSKKGAAAGSAGSTKYTVKKGDTLTRIAGRSGISVDKLMKINGLKSNALKAGQTLSLSSGSSSSPAPVTTVTKKTTKPTTTEAAPKPTPGKLYYVKHEVKRGENISQLARKYDVSVESILMANNLPEDSTLIPGRTVSVPVRGSSSKLTATTKTTDGKTATTKQAYEVQGKDTFYSLSVEYGISVEELREANPGVNPDRLRTGMVLKIPVRGNRKEPSAITKGTEEPAATTTPPANGFSAQDLHPNKNVKPAQGSTKGQYKPVITDDLPPLNIVPEGVDPYFDYTIEPSDSWDSIGAQFHTTADEIKRINGAKSTDEAQVGSTISVPRTRVGNRPGTRTGRTLG